MKNTKKLKTESDSIGTKDKPTKRKKKNVSITAILIIIFIAGLSLLLYPSLANLWNQSHATRAIASYSSKLSEMDPKELEKLYMDAVAYNEDLGSKEQHFKLSDEELKEYNSLLNLTGDGIMGYIEIRDLDVNLPIYHTVDEEILKVAAGHIEWSSLPVGGVNSHCILSGHRGLPSAKLFTDLDEMREGDKFTLNILNQVLTYEVDQIRIVEPNDTKELLIQQGQDYCTLVTCTPYGINTHRLLVRGHRVPNESGIDGRVISEAIVIEPLIIAPIVAIPVLLILLIWVLRDRKNNKDKHKRSSSKNKKSAKDKNKKDSSHDKKSGKGKIVNEDISAKGVVKDEKIET